MKQNSRRKHYAPAAAFLYARAALNMSAQSTTNPNVSEQRERTPQVAPQAL
jgi:hypothetical protein